MMLTRLWLILASAFMVTFFLSNNALAETLTVQTIHYQYASKTPNLGKFSLPFVVSKQPKIAKKINDYLYIDILQTLAPANAKEKIIRSMAPEAMFDAAAGVDQLTYRINLNNSHLISLTTSGDYCGAYCEDGLEVHYSFDIATGQYITMQDIFSKEGAKTLAHQLYLKRAETLKQAIKELNGDDIYEECLKREETVESELQTFMIDAKGITFTVGRCGSHANRAGDDIGDFKNSYTFKALKPYLSDYAKQILLNEKNKAPRPSSVDSQVLYGQIGAAKITLLLGKPYKDGSFSGMYFYHKHRAAINLKGDYANNIYTLTESDSKLEKQPVIVVKQQGNTLVGEWRGDKTLKFQAAP